MKIKPSELGDLQENPILKGLPESLKNPKRYNTIERDLRLIMISDHQHKTPKAFENCKRCMVKLEKRRKAIKDYGFADYHQYLVWRQVMEIIKNKKDFIL